MIESTTGEHVLYTITNLGCSKASSIVPFHSAVNTHMQPTPAIGYMYILLDRQSEQLFFVQFEFESYL